jgi:hypothetical protein
VKTSKTKPTSDVTNGKSSKHHDDARRSSSSKSSSRPKAASNSSPNVASNSKAPSSTSTDPNMLDPLAFAAAAAAASGGLAFPYFLPSLLPQSSSATNANASSGTTTNPSTYPFSALSTSLANPTAGLYPFLSPDWFTSASAMTNLTPGKMNIISIDTNSACLLLQRQNHRRNDRNRFEH